MIYFIVFFLSCLCTYLAQKAFEKKKKRKGIVFSIIAILMPCALAGYRSLDIGTDLKVYVNPFFKGAVYSSGFMQYKKSVDTELLYCVLNYIVSLFTDDVNILLFIIQLIMTTLIYIYVYDQREEVPMWLAMATYYAFIFPRFLNLIRQGIAVSVVLYSIKYLKRGQKIKYFITMGIALLCHSTAFCALPIYGIYIIYSNSNKIKKKKNIMYIIYLIMIVLLFGYDKILSLFISMGIVPEKFESYLTTFFKSNQKFDWSSTFYKLIWLIVLILPYKNKNEIKDYNFYYSLLIMDLILWNFNYKIVNAERISYYYYTIASITLIPQTSKLYKKDKFNQLIIYVGTIFLFIAYWYLKFIYLNAGKIYPYHSTILGI